ncbi:hypothetical protein K491DRAFT_729826 [Lophiostoma macrostomum CBS 122681]|uniref:Uncharacterized protein n=1 Tax=Lophiostoma macrostomum CBS 122681 TaxID=1314788 RepID=A0A6A6SU16_9PLEO|nr:hypothetical protein K491DRAFT_729826 [Lophiostoma macrostomum CBS 122681]
MTAEMTRTVYISLDWLNTFVGNDRTLSLCTNRSLVTVSLANSLTGFAAQVSSCWEGASCVANDGYCHTPFVHPHTTRRTPSLPVVSTDSQLSHAFYSLTIVITLATSKILATMPDEDLSRNESETQPATGHSTQEDGRGRGSSFELNKADMITPSGTPTSTLDCSTAPMQHPQPSQLQKEGSIVPPRADSPQSFEHSNVDTSENDDLYARDIDPPLHYNLAQSANKTRNQISDLSGAYEFAQSKRLNRDSFGGVKAEFGGQCGRLLDAWRARKGIEDALEKIDSISLPNGGRFAFVGDGVTGLLVFEDAVTVTLREWEAILMTTGVESVRYLLIGLAITYRQTSNIEWKLQRQRAILENYAHQWRKKNPGRSAERYPPAYCKSLERNLDDLDQDVVPHSRERHGREPQNKRVNEQYPASHESQYETWKRLKVDKENFTSRKVNQPVQNSTAPKRLPMKSKLRSKSMPLANRVVLSEHVRRQQSEECLQMAKLRAQVDDEGRNQWRLSELRNIVPWSREFWENTQRDIERLMNARARRGDIVEMRNEQERKKEKKRIQGRLSTSTTGSLTSPVSSSAEGLQAEKAPTEESLLEIPRTSQLPLPEPRPISPKRAMWLQEMHEEPESMPPLMTAPLKKSQQSPSPLRSTGQPKSLQPQPPPSSYPNPGFEPFPPFTGFKSPPASPRPRVAELAVPQPMFTPSSSTSSAPTRVPNNSTNPFRSQSPPQRHLPPSSSESMQFTSHPRLTRTQSPNLRPLWPRERAVHEILEDWRHFPEELRGRSRSFYL